MVVPQRLLPKVADVLAQIGPRAGLLSQPVLAEFISDGSFATHIRRMRRLYRDRQKALLDALDTHAQGLFSAGPAAGGMHLVADLDPRLARRMGDKDVSNAARTIGLQVAPLSGYFDGPADQQGLVMGYAAFAPETIEDAVRRLCETVCDFAR